MKSVPYAGVLGLAIGLLTAPLVRAEQVLWRPATSQQLEQASHLVVLGKIVEVIPGQPGPQAEDIGILRIEQTLKGRSSENQISLRYPSAKRGQWMPQGDFEVDRSPGLIRYDLDQDGIFFLRANGDGSYSANHPARFKPRFFLSKVRRELASGGR